MKIIVEVNNNNNSIKRIKENKIFDLGSMSSTLEDLLSNTYIQINEDITPILKITDLNGDINYYSIVYNAEQNASIDYILEISSDNLLKISTENLTGFKSDNENIATIIQRCANNDFRQAHGTLMNSNRMFVGTRGSSRVAMYYDLDDLSNRDLIDIPDIVGVTQGIETVCPTQVLNEWAAPISNTRKLIQFTDIDDVSQYVIHDITGWTNANRGFGGSASITSDGTFLYIQTEKSGVYNEPCIAKIDLSDFSLVSDDVLVFTNTNGAHCGAMTDTQWLVGASSGTNSSLIRTDISDMSNVQMPLGMSTLTDDMAMIPSAVLGFSCVVVGSEAEQNDGLNVAIINVDDMKVARRLPFLPTLGLFFDPLTNTLYSCAIAGFIQSMDISNIMSFENDDDPYTLLKTYSLRGVTPNEMFIQTDVITPRLFVTDWTSVTLGSLMEIRLDAVGSNVFFEEIAKETIYPRLTKEAIYYFTNFNGVDAFEGMREKSNSIGINFDIFWTNTGRIEVTNFDYNRHLLDFYPNESSGKNYSFDLFGGIEFRIYDSSNTEIDTPFSAGGHFIIREIPA